MPVRYTFSRVGPGKNILIAAVFCGILLGAEWGARRILPEVPRSDEVPRNPYRFRGWPEFTAPAPATSTGTARIVWLSNSQAYAGEIPANRIYLAQLAKRLAANPTGGFENWTIQNWSFDGVTSIELMLMATRLRADSATPDLAVTAVGLADFSSMNLQRRFPDCRTDLPRLAARPAIWSLLPDGFKRRHVKSEDWLTQAAHDHSALIRGRDYLWSWLDQNWSGLQMGLYAPNYNFHPWRLDAARERANLGGPPWRRKQSLKVVYGPEARVLIAEYLDQFRAIPARRHLVLVVPHQLRQGHAMGDESPRFRADLRELAEARGLTFWDEADLYPRELFIDGLHFKPDGHQRFAEHLAGRLPSLFEN